MNCACAGEFELLSQPVGVPLVAFRLKPRMDEAGEGQLVQRVVSGPHQNSSSAAKPYMDRCLGTSSV